MIPVQDQATIRDHFKKELRSRVRLDLFVQKPSPILVPGRPECPLCEDAQTLARELALLSEKIALTEHDLYAEPKAAADLAVDRVPALVLRGASNRPVRTFGMPTGAGFSTFVDTIVEVSRGTNELQAGTTAMLKRIRDEVRVQVFVTPSCSHSPAVARAAYRIALQNHHVRADVLEITEFPDLQQRYPVTATPTVVIEERLVLTGAIEEATLVECLLKVVEGKPVDPAAVKTGASTPLTASQPQEVRLPGSGLIIPR